MPTTHPPVAHYNRGAVQPIDFLEGWFTPAEYRGFCAGTALYYILRHQYKGTPLADLKKARDYINFLIEHEEKQSVEEEMNR